MNGAQGAAADSGSEFDPVEWLKEFEANDGWFALEADGTPRVAWRVWGSTKTKQERAESMARSSSSEDLAAVASARLAEAEDFAPRDWCRAFIAAKGGVHVGDGGQPTIGAPAEDAFEALRMMSRLLPVEQAQLRAFLEDALALEVLQ